MGEIESQIIYSPSLANFRYPGSLLQKAFCNILRPLVSPRKQSSLLAHLHRKNKSAQKGANVFTGGDVGN